jgi:hypothetical protein
MSNIVVAEGFMKTIRNLIQGTSLGLKRGNGRVIDSYIIRKSIILLYYYDDQTKDDEISGGGGM